MRKLIFLLMACLMLLGSQLHAALTIYKGGQTIITGTWHGEGVLTEISTNTPFEGLQHYQFAYNFSNWWAGYGLNFNSWGAGSAVDFSGNSHLRVAYRGASGSQVFRVKLRSGNTYSSIVDVGTPNTTYQVVDIPLSSFTGLSLTAITEMDFEIGNIQTGSGIVFLDAIELINLTVAPPPPSSAITWARVNAMGKGFNTANWLEAHWLLPFNAYPVVNDYTKARFQALKTAGFNNVRLPVIFERMGSTTAPYTLTTNQTAFHLVDSAVSWANQLNMKLIIVNHHGYDLNNGNFNAETPRLCAVWKQLVQRYGSLDPNRYIFEIYNEPNNITNANWRTVAQTMVDTIRKYNTTHTLVVGGNGWNSMSGLTSFTPLNDNNIAYTFHCYDPWFFTHQGMSWTSPAYLGAKTFPVNNDINDLRNAFIAIKQWSNTYNVAVFMGEFGVGVPADATSRCSYVEKVTHFSDSLSLPWTYWDVKNYNDAFGFYPSGVMNSTSIIPCFKTAMGLYQTPLALHELNDLQAHCNGKQMRLNWTASIYDKAGLFIAEKSQDGIRWEATQNIKADLNRSNYEANFPIFSKEKYFRLAYIEIDGRIEYSEIITADCSKNDALLVYPNPVSGSDLNLTFITDTHQNCKMMLYNINGQVVQSQSFFANNGENSLKIAINHLTKGIYQLLLVTEYGSTMSAKIIKN